jgi:hypothetical protein
MEETQTMENDPGYPQATSPGEHCMDESVPRVTLAGRFRRRGKRWWWEVQLPGEDKAKARPLRPAEGKPATDDREMAERIALATWEQALRETAERQVREEADRKIAELQAQFLEKVQSFSLMVDDAMAKAEAATLAREELEARLNEATTVPLPARPCECCGAVDLSPAELTQISSGQWLCPDCMAALRDVGQRSRSQEPPTSSCRLGQ